VTTVLAEAYKEAMIGPFVLACALVLTGAVLAGCGDSAQQAVRQEAKQLLGDGHPKILRIETVRDVGGNRLVVATLKGHFKALRLSCGLGPCRPSPPISYAWLSFSVPKDMSGIGTTSAAQLAAINNAKSAKSIFGIFPDFTHPAIRCAIPRGNSSGTIAGACITLFNTGTIGPRAHVDSIKFRERWPFVPTRDGHWPRNEKTGGWIVTLDANEHVQSIRVIGSLPPQLWK
jgi:hypothetical protein